MPYLRAATPAVAIIALPVAGSKPKLSHTSPRAWVRSYDLRSGNTPDRRVAGAVEGQHPDHVIGAARDFRRRDHDRLQPGGAGLLDVETGNSHPHAARHQRRGPELPVPGNCRTDHQVLEPALGHPAQTEDPAHGLTGELANVDLGQGRGLPRRERSCSPRCRTEFAPRGTWRCPRSSAAPSRSIVSSKSLRVSIIDSLHHDPRLPLRSAIQHSQTHNSKLRTPSSYFEQEVRRCDHVHRRNRGPATALNPSHS